MTRFSIPRRLWLAFFWGSAFALVLAFRFESDYHYRLKHLPVLMDEHGHTASLEAAMSGLDSYDQAKQIRQYGFVSLGIGILLCACAAFTKIKAKDNATV